MHAVTTGFFEVDCPCRCRSTSFLAGSSCSVWLPVEGIEYVDFEEYLHTYITLHYLTSLLTFFLTALQGLHAVLAGSFRLVAY